MKARPKMKNAILNIRGRGRAEGRSTVMRREATVPGDGIFTVMAKAMTIPGKERFIVRREMENGPGEEPSIGMKETANALKDALSAVTAKEMTVPGGLFTTGNLSKVAAVAAE